MHLIATNFFGGPEKQIVYHLKYLNSTEKYMGILASFRENGENQLLQVARNHDIQTVEIRSKNAYDIRAIKQIVDAIRMHRIQLLCSHHYKSTIFGRIAAFLTGIPIIAYSRGFTGENQKVAFYEWLERRFMNRTDGIICVSKGQKRKIRELGVRKPPQWVIYNAIENISDTPLNNKQNPGHENNGKLIITTAGRLSPEKGHEYLLKAISILKESYSNIEFLICGDGALMEKLTTMAESLNIRDQCKFLGFCRDMDAIYSKTDIFVLSSLSEGLPNVILEAYMHEIPVVATNVGGVPEIIDNGFNGILVPPGDPVKLADALAQLIQDKTLREKMGRHGKEKVASCFTFKRQLDDTVKVYEEVLK